MMLAAVGAASALLVSTALLALVAGGRRALPVASWGAVAAAALGGPASLLALVRGFEPESTRVAWSLPVGEAHVGIDALSSFFLLCIFLVSGLAALYGLGYLPAHAGERSLRAPAAGFNLLVVAMIGVVVARDGVLFLLAWEVMTLASYFLVTFDDRREEVRRAGFTYLIASQVGTLFVFFLFALLARPGGGASYDFDTFASGGAPATLCLLLALAGFGTKAGLWPLHLWLPEAHPAAPSHVSAVLSGVMVKMGIYGILRTLTFLGPPRLAWAAGLVAVGAASALAGVLHAAAERDLKRLLAYSTVENVGVITLGIGTGLLGQATGHGDVAALGYAAALLHVLNHALFKGLLFGGAGSVLLGTHARDLNAMGGLLGRMPWTGATFLAGSLSLAGLPPLGGFASEWLLYLASFRALAGGGSGGGLAVAVIAMLGLASGLALLTLVKAFGLAFLGLPRTAAAAAAREAGWPMRAALAAGAAGCLLLGLFPQGAARLVAPAAGTIVRSPAGASGLARALVPLARLGLALAAAAALVALARLALLRRRPVEAGTTWACGYAAVTARMQYTAGSFSAPAIEPFAPLLLRRARADGPAGYFPLAASYDLRPSDVAGERIVLPALRRILAGLGRVRRLQHGQTNVYLLYILLTLLALLFFRLASA